MDSLELIRILILSNQIYTINKILSNLRNQGVDLNAQVVSNKIELNKKLKFQNWDIILCCDDSPVSIDILVNILKNHDLKLPIIFITVKESPSKYTELLSIGVNDCFPIGEKSKIIAAIKREIGFQRLKQSYRLLKLEFKELENRHEAIMDASTFPLAYIQEGMHLYCNESYAQIFSNSNHHIIKQSPLLDLFKGESRKLLKIALSKKLESELKLTLRLSNIRHGVIEGDSEIAFSFTPITFNGQSCLQLIARPAIGNPSYSDQLFVANSQDLLTTLYNKSFFYEKIELAVSKAIKQQQYSSLLIIQLNEFLDIKSHLGLNKANQVLSDVAAFLKTSIQKLFHAARLDDFEFGLLIDNCKLAESIELANFIKSKINNHITITALPSMQLSCSIGVVLINENALDAKDLVAKARVNQHKKLADINVSVSKDVQHHDMDTLTVDIRLALKEKRLKILFQPILGLKNEYFQDYEVFSRMLDKEGNDMLPNEYLPVTDLSGLGDELDKLVVCQALNALDKASSKNIRLIINLTSNTLLSKTFLPWLRTTLELKSISPERILFQISETQVCNHLEYCSTFSNGLRELGLGCIISDYGCVAKPENYLDDIKPVCVKLDKSLVRDIGFNQYQHNELKNLFVDLHKKHFKIGVSHVEDSSMLPILYKLGADFIQGYSIERPQQTMNYKFIQNYEITLGNTMYNQ